MLRKLAALPLIPAALLMAGPAAAAPGHSPKVWVCKYVHTPGAETEVLKPGKQPIAVHGSATVGQLFNDAQGGSLVVDQVSEDNTSPRGNTYVGPFTCPQSLDQDPDEDPGDPDDGIILN